MISEEMIRQARVLVVDDQHPNVQLLTRMLAAAGYTAVSSTCDSREVVARYTAERPDLVLLDLRMPHLDGFQLLELLRRVELEAYAPVLVLTAQADLPSRLRALELGARDFLTKPFDRVEVLTRIRNLLEVRLLYRQVRAQNDELERRVEARTRELQEAQLEIIHRLSRAVEFRDNETGQHTVRMGRFAAVIGRALGLGEAECHLLQQACPMHDVGKLGIPDRILLKPGPLTPEEWSIMKTHAVIGGNLLADGRSPLVQMARTIALSHHEKWDGTGYPHGLRGEAIPLYGRICALCDVFDALTSARPYKDPWPVDRAVAEIDRLSGIHFDPAVVAAFRRVLPELIHIKECHAD